MIPDLPPGCTMKDIDSGEEPIGIDYDGTTCVCGTVTTNKGGLCDWCQNHYEAADRDYDQRKEEGNL